MLDLDATAYLTADEHNVVLNERFSYLKDGVPTAATRVVGYYGTLDRALRAWRQRADLTTTRAERLRGLLRDSARQAEPLRNTRASVQLAQDLLVVAHPDGVALRRRRGTAKTGADVFADTWHWDLQQLAERLREELLRRAIGGDNNAHDLGRIVAAFGAAADQTATLLSAARPIAAAPDPTDLAAPRTRSTAAASSTPPRRQRRKAAACA